MPIFNWGMEGYAWIMVLVFMILALLAYGMVWNMLKVAKAKTRKRRRKYIMQSMTFCVVGAIIVIFVFFSYGSGRRIQVAPAENEGMRQMVEQMPDEKGKEVIEKEAYDSRPESLKKQDRGFEQEAKEAEEYIKKALETYNKE
ncbi:hypothetical protein KAR91_23380 [Candidatus Pacearchaeota archaeon]|nr:hypothetical protein [Candidatus Pacearchaeota archaeon]